MTEKVFEKGIILKGVGGLYTVRPLSECEGQENRTYTCRARGVFRHEGITPLPGDIVTLAPADSAERTDDGEFVIDAIDERKSYLIRPALANLTHLFAVIPAAEPAPDIYSADKLISAAENKGIEPVVIVTKADTAQESANAIYETYTKGGFTVILTDKDGKGDTYLTDYIEKQADKGFFCAAFAGVSGAGKSTLMTRLFPDLNLKTGEVSRKIQRGRHTTRHAELYPMECKESTYYIADTPGFSMIDFARFNFVEEDELPYSFREFAPLMGECRYKKCTHTKEEGCAVLQSVKSGEIAKSRHASYIMMLEEIKKNPPWKRKNLQS